MISERGDEARDNGYAFYKYMKRSHPEIKLKYIITKDSYDLHRIDKADIIFKQTLSHHLAFLNSKFLISTHHMGCSPEFGMFGKLDDCNLVFTRGKRIFLQHGIIYNYLPSLVNKKINLFITSSEMERQFIIEQFNYKSKVVKCTGLARYDDLIPSNKNYILVMPTWRSYLYYCNENQILKSDYYNNWLNFLNNSDLTNKLNTEKLKLIFYPHYEAQKYFTQDKIKNKNVILASATKYDIHELLKNCTMFITDYSSTFFDVAYMHKPIIYFVFDYKDFYLKHYKKGYIDIKKEGFGIPCENLNQLVIETLKMIDTSFKTEKKYLIKEKKFYKYNDKNNCERIYEEICNLN